MGFTPYIGGRFSSLASDFFAQHLIR